MAESFRLSRDFTRRTAHAVRSWEQIPEPQIRPNQRRVHSQPPVFWLCSHTAAIEPGTSTEVSILQGSVGNESPIPGEPPLRVLNTLGSTIPAGQKFWAAAGRVFGNETDDKFYIIAASGGAAASTPVASWSGAITGTGQPLWGTEFSQGGSWQLVAGGILVPVNGYYLCSWNAHDVNYRIDVNDPSNRADMIRALHVAGWMNNASSGNFANASGSVLVQVGAGGLLPSFEEHDFTHTDLNIGCAHAAWCGTTEPTNLNVEMSSRLNMACQLTMFLIQQLDLSGA